VNVESTVVGEMDQKFYFYTYYV